jgi:hypothetical protein
MSEYEDLMRRKAALEAGTTWGKQPNVTEPGMTDDDPSYREPWQNGRLSTCPISDEEQIVAHAVEAGATYVPPEPKYD